jgi:hypothetical protein
MLMAEHAVNDVFDQRPDEESCGEDGESGEH